MVNVLRGHPFGRPVFLLAASAILISAKCQSDGPQRRFVEPGDRVGNSLAETASRFAAATAERRTFEPSNTGDPVPADDYLWQVGLRVTANGQRWRCGGILISPSYVLTAAHCLDAARYDNFNDIWQARPENIEVFHGDRIYAAGNKYAVDSSTIHPRWKVDKVEFAYDAALIRLRQPISGTVAPIRNGAVPNGMAVVSGWGAYDAGDVVSHELRAVAVPVVDNPTCSAHLPVAKRPWVIAATLCTESPQDDACGGDSGGPLVIGSRQRPQTIGIVSWGPSGHCTFRGPNNTMVGAYTRAAAVAQWVHQVTGDSRALTTANPEPLFAVRPIQSGGGVDQ